jgi:hypothetical protein
MKFEDFKKYKKIAESQDFEALQEFPEAEKVYNWMEETGRIDEGFWGAIWSWLKKNLSPTARKIHSLANEYEKELESEMQAEYGKLKNSKDLDAKFRRSFAGRVAEDIEEKMQIIAGDDDDYRELVKTLVNKKNLAVKKRLLKELIGKADPDDEEVFNGTRDWLAGQEAEAEKSYKSALDKTMHQNPNAFKESTEILRKKITGNKEFIEMGYDTSEKVQKIVQKLLVYQNGLSDQGKADFTVKAIETTLKNFKEFIISGAKKLESSKVSYKQALAAIVEATEKRLVSNKPVVFSKMQSEVFREAENKIKALTASAKPEVPSTDAEKEVEKEVTGPLTGEIIEPEEVEKTIHKAATETGSKKPSEEEIIDELNDAVKTYFENNLKFFVEEITKRVERFNKLSETERNAQKGEFDYILNTDNKLEMPEEKDINALYKNLLQVAGKIVPFYNLEKGKRSKAFYMVLDFMFEIYAIKKNSTGDLSSKDIDTLVENIKEKYD